MLLLLPDKIAKSWRGESEINVVVNDDSAIPERKKQIRRPDDERDQYPEPPLPDVAEELAAGVAPETVISCHSPPEAVRALPLA